MKFKQNLPFPKDFLWGASTSAYQVEGAASTDGRGPSVQDLKKLPEGTASLDVTSDHYHRFKEDVELFAEMGLKAYRFSISWSRILPKGTGEINPKGIDFYNQLIDECLSYGIEPIVTMFHFDMPAVLDEKGSWSNRESINWFVQYAKILFENFGDRVKYWLTINEQNCYVLEADIIGTITGKENEDILPIAFQQNHHMLVAQAEVMNLCHEMLPNAKIGPAPNISYVYPLTARPEDSIAAQNFSALRNWLFLDAAVYGIYNTIASTFLKQKGYYPKILPSDFEILKKGKPDFIAFNYYSTATIQQPNEFDQSFKGDQQTGGTEPDFYKYVGNSYLEKTAFGWEIDPIGFRLTIRELESRYHLPLIVTENGIGAYDILTEDKKIHDDYRIDYLDKHIQQIQLAINDGIDIFGFCPWSAIDLVSTHEGVKKRYGFIYVDRDEFDLKTLERIRKDSFYWYQEIIRRNGLSEE